MVHLLEAGIERERPGARLRVVGDLGAVGGIGFAAILPDEDFAPPVVVLPRDVERHSDLLEIARGVALDDRLGGGDQLVERLRRLVGIETRLLEQVLVVEQRHAAHGRRQAVILPATLHRRNDREEVALDLGILEDGFRQRLHELAGDEGVEPAVEELHHLGSSAGGLGRDQPRLVVGIGEGHLLDGDVRIRGLELLDQLGHRLDTGVEDVLPILDLDRLGAPRSNAENSEGHDRSQKRPARDFCKAHLDILPSITVCQCIMQALAC